MTKLKLVQPEPKTDVDKAFANFQIVAKEIGIPVPRFLGVRRAKLSQRLKDIGGLEVWNEALVKLENSSFCTGATGWKASFDFLLQESSLYKLLEGNYSDRD